MENRQINAIVKVLTICAVLFLSSFASNEIWGAEKKFPNRNINLVVAYNPGATDTYLRPYIEKIQEYLGQPISFVYKPGAAGTVGTSFLAKAKPDGYTLLGTSPGAVILGPITKEGLDYTLDSLVPICRLVMVPMFLAVNTESPLKTVDDIIAAAKASPGKLTYSSSGVFGSTHFAMEMFQKSAGIKLTHVPCNGDAPAVTALLGGHVVMNVSGIGPLKPHVAAGSVRLIALMDEKRVQSYPGVPTFLEVGHRVIFSLWYGLMAPKGTPKEVIDTIYDAAKKTNDLNRDFIEERCKLLGVEISFLNAGEFDKANRDQLKAVEAIFKDIQGQSK